MIECPNDDELLSLLGRDADANAKARMDAHLDVCNECSDTVAQYARFESAGSGPIGVAADMVIPGSGDKFGRYTILDLVGSGAMGWVFTAYDPKLDRRVALKLLKMPDSEDRELRDNYRRRCQKEAQAAATLTHDHIVGVYDVGDDSGQPYIAMEFVDGGNVAEWLCEGQRSWAQRVELLLGAAHGIAAGHDVGLLHRDIKPSNILVTRGGKAKVTDFGVAVGDGERIRDEKWQEVSEKGSLLDRDGSLLGTPAYMAPEVLNGGAASPASDQYSFGITLYEALFGRRPYSGNSVGELLRQLEQPLMIPRQTEVPSRILRVLERCLAADPAARYDSMAEVIAGLDIRRASSRRRRVGIVALAAAMVSVGVGGTLLFAGSEKAAGAICEDSAAEMAQHWSPRHRAEIEAGFANAKGIRAGSDLIEVRRHMAKVAQQWVAGRERVCRDAAAGVTAERDKLVSDFCLDRQKHEFIRLQQAIAGGVPTEATGDARRRVQRLADAVRQCVTDNPDRRELPSVPRDAGLRAQILDLQRAVTDSEPIDFTRKKPRDVAVFDSLIERADELGYAPLRALSRQKKIQALRLVGGTDAMIDLARQIAPIAAKSKMDLTVARALIILVELRRPQDPNLAALEFQARNAILRAGAPAFLLGDLALSLGRVHRREGRHDDSLTALHAARKHFASDPAQSVKHAAALEEIGFTFYARDQLRDAEVWLMRSVEAMRSAGEPELAEWNESNLMMMQAYYLRGSFRAALKQVKADLMAKQEIFGERAPITWGLRQTYAGLSSAFGNDDQARAVLHSLLADKVKRLGGDHPRVQTLRLFVAEALFRGGLFAEADAVLRAISLWARGDRRSRMDHFRTAQQLRARVLVALGKPRAAKNALAKSAVDDLETALPNVRAERALVELEVAFASGAKRQSRAAARTRLTAVDQMVGRQGFAMIEALVHVALTAIDAGQHAEAIAHCARAQEIVEALGPSELPAAATDAFACDALVRNDDDALSEARRRYRGLNTRELHHPMREILRRLGMTAAQRKNDG